MHFYTLAKRRIAYLIAHVHMTLVEINVVTRRPMANPFDHQYLQSTYLAFIKYHTIPYHSPHWLGLPQFQPEARFYLKRKAHYTQSERPLKTKSQRN